MALLEFTQRRFASAINNVSDATLSANQLRLSWPRDNPGPFYKADTLVRISANAPESYRGSIVLSYERVPLQIVSNMLNVPVGVPEGTLSVDTFLKYLEYQTGIRLTKDGLTITQPAGGSITLTATSNNHFFTGQAVFQVTPIAPIVEADSIVVNTLSGIVEDTGKDFAELYNWPLDATADKSILSTIVTSQVDFTDLATVLTKLTGDSWVTDTVAPYSLKDAVVYQAGLTTASLGTDTNYKYVAIIELSKACTALEGYLYIHYN